MALRPVLLPASLRPDRLQRLFISSPEPLQRCICEQRRGKKSLTKSSSVKVKLLEDIPKYGRRGAIVPVAAGRMRNYWYPRRKADYVTDAHLRDSSLRDVPTERDFNFRPDLRGAGLEPDVPDSGSVVDMQSQLLAPQRATELISNLIPSVINFYRVPIPSPSTEKPQDTYTRSSGRAINSAAADLAAASEPVPEPAPAAIYGSVSTQDVVSAIKAVLASDNDGVRVVLGAEDVSFIQTTESEGSSDIDRMKTLGEFEIAITVKGGGPVARRVRVNAQEAEA